MLQVLIVGAIILLGVVLLACALGAILLFIWVFGKLSKLRMLLTHLRELASWFDMTADGLEFASSTAIAAGGVLKTGGTTLTSAGAKLDGMELPAVITEDKTLSLWKPSGPFDKPPDVTIGDNTWSAPDGWVLNAPSVGSARVFPNGESPVTTAGNRIQDVSKHLGTEQNQPNTLAYHFSESAKALRQIAIILRDIAP